MQRNFKFVAVAVLLAGCGNTTETSTSDFGGGAAPAPAAVTTFVDPTAVRQGSVTLGQDVYVGPFAKVAGTVVVGDRSNLQDNTRVEGTVTIGPDVVVAHGASVLGSARLQGSNFIGFNAQVDGAVLETKTAVEALGRVGPGVTLHTGMRVLPGRNVTTQAEADNPSLGKVGPVDPALEKFVKDVIEVNIALARGYNVLQQSGLVGGVGPNPPTSFAEGAIPRLAGTPVQDPYFRNRIIGDVRWDDTLAQLTSRMGFNDSVRADEGQPILLGHLGSMADQVTFHALDHTGVAVGDLCHFGRHSVIHGGADNDTELDFCVVGNQCRVGDDAVVFRSILNDGVVVGEKCLLDRSHFAAGTVIPAREIWIEDKKLGLVEW